MWESFYVCVCVYSESIVVMFMTFAWGTSAFQALLRDCMSETNIAMNFPARRWLNVLPIAEQRWLHWIITWKMHEIHTIQILSHWQRSRAMHTLTHSHKRTQKTRGRWTSYVAHLSLSCSLPLSFYVCVFFGRESFMFDCSASIANYWRITRTKTKTDLLSQPSKMVSCQWLTMQNEVPFRQNAFHNLTLKAFRF